MNILVIGSGGREHAMVWKLRQSAVVERVWCAPGNGGISTDAECIPLDVKDVRASAELASKLQVHLTVVGTETPLVLGVADEFATRGMTLLGPSQKAAQLEGSKVFAKQFLQRHKIPTAPTYGVYNSAADALGALSSADWPLVIKADGLCAGKGVLVAHSADEAIPFIARCMESGEFGEAGKRLLFERGLAGDELSYIVLTDGREFIPLAPSRDHKRAFDHDQGPNTGGMGAYSADGMLPSALEDQIVTTIVRPTLAGLAEDGITYRGFLYFGLMLTAEGPQVLEFNCRLGDPEAQAILLRADFDFAQACLEAAKGNLSAIHARWHAGASVCVVLASEGYPGTPTTGKPITGLEKAAATPGAVVFHSGTLRAANQSQYFTAGGRVLGIAARANNLEAACQIAYDAASKITFPGMHYRRDIGRHKDAKGQAAGDPNA